MKAKTSERYGLALPKPRIAPTARVLMAQVLREGERFTDACAALTARLLRDGMHPEAREVQQVAIEVGTQLGAWAVRAQLAEAKDGAGHE